jgi:hypothetical protein
VEFTGIGVSGPARGMPFGVRGVVGGLNWSLGLEAN